MVVGFAFLVFSDFACESSGLGVLVVVCCWLCVVC